MEKRGILFKGLLVILMILVGYLLYSNYQLNLALPGGLSHGSSVPPPPEGNPDTGLVSNTFFPEQVVIGAVTDISASSVTLRSGEAARTFTITSATHVFRQGTPKSQAQMETEIAAYNAQVTELMKDPVANQTKLENLIPPPPTTLTSVQTSAIKQGDTIAVLPAEGDTKTALRIEIISN